MKKQSGSLGVDSSHWSEIPLQGFSFVAAFFSTGNGSSGENEVNSLSNLYSKVQRVGENKGILYLDHIRMCGKESIPVNLNFSSIISFTWWSISHKHTFMDCLPHCCSQSCYNQNQCFSYWLQLIFW